MAKNGSEAPGASGGEAEAPPAEGKKKRKGLAALRSLQRFFRGKNKESKEEAGPSKAKSTSNVRDISKGNQEPSLSSKNLSMSDDSIFQDKGQYSKAIPKGAIDAELRARVQREGGGATREGDEGLPHSPPSHATTVDALIENGLRENSQSYDSDHSFLSIDNSDAEMEEMEDFFKPSSWSLSKLDVSHASGSSSVDLDAVPSTSKVNLKPQMDKLGVKPKGKRQSTAYAQRKRAASPKTHVTTSLQVLPQVSEEETVVKEIDIIDDQQTKRPAEKLEPDPEPKKEKSSPLIMASDSGNEDTTDKDASTPEEEEKDKEQPEATETAPLTPTTPTTPDLTNKKPLLRRSSVPEVKLVEESEAQPTSVVKRRENFVKVTDPEKRQTISSAAEHTMFGEKVVSKRASAFEPKDWENVGKNSKTSEEPKEDEGETEFSKMVSKFKRNASQKKAELKREADKLDQKPKPASVVTDQKPKPASVVTDQKPKPASVVTDQKTKPASVVTDQKPKPASVVTDQKPKLAPVVKESCLSDSKVLLRPAKSEEKSTSRPHSMEKKSPRNSGEEASSTSKVVITLESKPKPSSTTNAHVTSQPKSFTQENKETTKTVPTTSEPVRPKPVAILGGAPGGIGKSQSLKVTKDSPRGSPTMFKRDSPVLRDRNRSKTLPEATVSDTEGKKVIVNDKPNDTSKKESSKLETPLDKPEKPLDRPVSIKPPSPPVESENKVSAAQTSSADKANITPAVPTTSTTPPAVSSSAASQKPPPGGGRTTKPLVVKSSVGGGGNEGISWIAMAKKKTQQWNTEHAQGLKDTKSEVTMEETKEVSPAPKSSVLDMVKSMERFKVS